MKTGDIVRFALWDEVDVRDSNNWHKTPKRHFGVLVEHDKLMNIAHVLHEGNIIKLRSVFVEKSGKKDYENY